MHYNLHGSSQEDPTGEERIKVEALTPDAVLLSMLQPHMHCQWYGGLTAKLKIMFTNYCAFLNVYITNIYGYHEISQEIETRK